MTGDVEEAVLEMYLSGISVRKKIAGVTEALSRVKVGKDAVSRIAKRLEGEQQRAWRERSLKEEKAYPYLYLDATYPCEGALGRERHEHGTPGLRRGRRGRLSGLSGGVLALEVAGAEKGAAYASLLRGLLDRGLQGGVRLVVSDDHEGIKAAVFGELPGAGWQGCVVHFERNVLSHVPASSTGEVAEDLKAIFKVRPEKTAWALCPRSLSSCMGSVSPRRFRCSRRG
jgi:putative transposase